MNNEKKVVVAIIAALLIGLASIAIAVNIPQTKQPTEKDKITIVYLYDPSDMSYKFMNPIIREFSRNYTVWQYNVQDYKAAFVRFNVTKSEVPVTIIFKGDKEVARFGVIEDVSYMQEIIDANS